MGEQYCQEILKEALHPHISLTPTVQKWQLCGVLSNSFQRRKSVCDNTGGIEKHATTK